MDVIKARAPVVNNEVKIPNIPDIQKIISICTIPGLDDVMKPGDVKKGYFRILSSPDANIFKNPCLKGQDGKETEILDFQIPFYALVECVEIKEEGAEMWGKLYTDGYIQLRSGSSILVKPIFCNGYVGSYGPASEIEGEMPTIVYADKEPEVVKKESEAYMLGVKPKLNPYIDTIVNEDCASLNIVLMNLAITNVILDKTEIAKFQTLVKKKHPGFQAVREEIGYEIGLLDHAIGLWDNQSHKIKVSMQYNRSFKI